MGNNKFKITNSQNSKEKVSKEFPSNFPNIKENLSSIGSSLPFFNKTDSIDYAPIYRRLDEFLGSESFNKQNLTDIEKRNLGKFEKAFHKPGKRGKEVQRLVQVNRGISPSDTVTKGQQLLFDNLNNLTDKDIAKLLSTDFSDIKNKGVVERLKKAFEIKPKGLSIIDAIRINNYFDSLQGITEYPNVHLGVREETIVKPTKHSGKEGVFKTFQNGGKMLVQSRFSKRRGGRIRPMIRNISINELQPFQDGGVPKKQEELVETDATREFLRSLGILGEDKVIDPRRAQAVFDFFPVTSVQGENIPLREARDLNDPANRAALERLRTTDRTSPFFGKSKSQARETYLQGIGGQADLRLKDLLSTASEPDNFSRNLLLDEESRFFNPARASQLSDLEDPLALERADPIFEPRVTELQEERGQFFADDRFKRGGGTIHIKPENRGKFTAAAKAMGHTVQEHASHILASDTASPLQKKRANFARNAAKWAKGCGGKIKIR